ncbi:MAG: DNA polymerase [Treponema sp.]|nr:DNA polymerase [Treponema sp.]
MNIAHLNIIGFRAAVAALKDRSLKGRPYVIAGRTGGQTVAKDVSPAALKEGIKIGSSLASAAHLVKELAVIEPDPAACFSVNKTLENVINRYAPVWQNDGIGNIYFDITGTQRLFGPAADCVCHIQNEIISALKIEAAAATGTNKLVCKVASRTIRPEGLIEIRPGEEAAFLAHQDIALLPGIGQSLMKTIRVTGFTEVGELAVLSDSEVLSLFGKKGILLRERARGIDNSPVAPGKGRSIESRADFPEDVIDEAVIRGSIACLAEHAGLQLRREKLGAYAIRFSAVYADGIHSDANEKRKYPLVLDKDIIKSAVNLCQKAVSRRIRIRGICLSLEDLRPLDYEPDLFEPETETSSRKLQEAVDSIKRRYGTGKITRGIVLYPPLRTNASLYPILLNLESTAALSP